MQIELRGVNLEVIFNYYPAERGQRDSYGAPLEPDWPAEYEVYAVTTEDEYSELLINETTDNIRSNDNIIEQLSNQIIMEIELELEEQRNEY